MKTLLSFSLILSIALVLSGCGSNDLLGNQNLEGSWKYVSGETFTNQESEFSLIQGPSKVNGKPTYYSKAQERFKGGRILEIEYAWDSANGGWGRSGQAVNLPYGLYLVDRNTIRSGRSPSSALYKRVK